MNAYSTGPYYCEKCRMPMCNSPIWGGAEPTLYCANEVCDLHNVRYHLPRVPLVRAEQRSEPE